MAILSGETELALGTIRVKQLTTPRVRPFQSSPLVPCISYRLGSLKLYKRKIMMGKYSQRRKSNPVLTLIGWKKPHEKPQ